MFDEDTSQQWLRFIDPIDCLNLSIASSKFNEVCRSEKLWEFYLSYVLSLTDYSATGGNVVALLKICTLSSAKKLFWAFRKISFGFVGWFRIIPLSLSESRGGLVCIRPVVRGERFVIVFESFESSGERIMCAQVELWDLKLIVRNAVIPLYSISFSDNSMFLDALPTLTLTEHPTVRSRLCLKPLLPFHARGILETQLPICKDQEAIKSCLGLFVAPYGSHGLELLQVTLSSAAELCRMGFEVVLPPTRHDLEVVLQGLKIVGDPNVPADKQSFIVDLSQPVDPRRQLEEDPRMVVVFPASGQPQVVDLRTRLRHITGWFRGWGQINRNPQNPLYEWMGLSLLVSQPRDVTCSCERPHEHIMTSRCCAGI